MWLRETSVILIFVSFCFAGFGDVRKAVIFQTSDIHGRITGNTNGICRLAGLLGKEIAESGGYKKCLLIDCGDIFAGTPEGLADKGALFMKYLNYCRYDLFVPGNHDLDLGAVNLMSLAGIFKGDVLAANLVCVLDGRQHHFIPWKIYERGGLKICVIGMVFCGGLDDDGRLCMSGIEPVLGRIMPEIMSNTPDFIVLAVHQGLYTRPAGQSMLTKILKKYPQINAVFAGHSHEVHAGKMISGRTSFIQPGFGGEYAAKTVLEYNTVSERKRITTELLPACMYKPDSRFMAYISENLNNIQRALSGIIACKIPSGKTYGRLISESMARAAGAEVGIYGLGYADRKCMGTVTFRDAYEYIPYENRIVSLKVSGRELKEILQSGFDYLHSTGKFKSFDFSGVGIEFDRKGKISEMRLDKDGKTVRKDDVISIAVTSYYSSGAGGRFKSLKSISGRKSSGLENTCIDQREAFIRNCRCDGEAD